VLKHIYSNEEFKNFPWNPRFKERGRERRDVGKGALKFSAFAEKFVFMSRVSW
jgi:hypothetical protein